jgi:lipopolysaccharide/colanic/teichoic acid biosynthesis glycosyltransferase
MAATALYTGLPELPKRAKVLKFLVDMIAVLVFFACPLIIVPFVLLLAVNWLYYLPRGGGLPIVATLRAGKYGRNFRFYQLRTHTRANQLTPFGRWLKHWAIDELPQIINIARRRMSLVGPRPVHPDELIHNADNRDLPFRFGALPGVCGLAIGTFTNAEAIELGYEKRQVSLWLALDRR